MTNERLIETEWRHLKYAPRNVKAGQLALAAERGDYAEYLRLKPRVKPVNVVGANLETLLMAAAAGGEARIVADVIAEGVEVNAREQKEGRTALHFACLLGRPEAAAALLAGGASAEERDRMGDPPLRAALQADKELRPPPSLKAVAEVMVAAGAELTEVRANSSSFYLIVLKGFVDLALAAVGQGALRALPSGHRPVLALDAARRRGCVDVQSKEYRRLQRKLREAEFS